MSDEDAGLWCVKYVESHRWIYGVKAFIATVIITENVVVFMAILQNWKNLMRQHNLYRYLLSLVAADLLNGTILLMHAIFWVVHTLVGLEFSGENFQEVLRNLITGVLHGLTFASLASAALLNLVLRVTSTRALARAAAITPHSQLCLSGVSWVRSPRISIGLIGLIWVITLTFIVMPLKHHCHMDLVQCLNGTGNISERSFVVFSTNEGILNEQDSPEAYDCSILRPPSRRIYLLVLNTFLTFCWCLMLICNVLTTCIKTKVQRGCVSITGRVHLKLRHSFGITRDSSSFFACIITLSMSVSTVPYIVFTFISEGGLPYDRIYCGKVYAGSVVEFFEMTTYISSIVNPIIYTAMLSHLRTDVSKILVRKLHSKRKPANKKAVSHNMNGGDKTKPLV